MPKAAPPAIVATGPRVYSATYSGIPVYEYQFGNDLKEHVMRRRQDDWINATHILKAAGFDKPARTRILERDVQKEVHEKIQGGYGKYQGTWIPLESAKDLASRHKVYDHLAPIFEYTQGDESPPPAPRHTSKPKAPKARPPPPPKWNPPPPVVEEYANNEDTAMADDDIPDNLTVASASFMADDDRFDMSHMSHMSTGHRKRKREEQMQDMTDQQHSLYGDELLDYFLLSRNEQPTVKPDPPPNFQPNWPIDLESHTALHWASAMGDLDVIKQLKRFAANVGVKNVRGETPLMRSLNFTNCFEKQTFPAVLTELWEAVQIRDAQGCTVIHHAAVMKNGRVYSPSCARYYLDIILNKLQETLDPQAFQEMLDAQDHEGNTALHMAAQKNGRKCIRALLGRHASTQIQNNEGIRAEELIIELNAAKKEQRGPQRSSSPFAPDSQKHTSYRDAYPQARRNPTPIFSSAAANTVQARITPLIMGKFQDLAKSYEDEWHQKDAAESDARRILTNNQADLAAVRQQIAELETELESEEAAAKTLSEANRAKQQVLQVITHQNRQHIQKEVETTLSKTNGDAATEEEESYDERLLLARQLNTMLAQIRQEESDYVDALSMVGTGDKIEKYRRLLKTCLVPEDGESLDMNLDSVVDMVEEQRAVHDMDGAPETEGDFM